MAVVVQSYQSITNGQQAYPSEFDNDVVCLEQHNKQRAAVGVRPLIWNPFLIIESEKYMATIDPDGQTITGRMLGRRRKRKKKKKEEQPVEKGEQCAEFSGTWNSIFETTAQEVKDVQKLQPDWTYSDAVANQFDATTMVIWWDHNQVGCAVMDRRRVCCYDTPGNILDAKIVNHPVIGLLLNGLPPPNPAPPGPTRLDGSGRQ
uniref:AlNc14C160G7743 protein n=1 Tax=Albugo laibachii Nc14 TaxID=890382 RepID=F0WMQ7_9STRA|nr:AlNc14C160G7743 [Albugo laibachii Nc14]|eukprot:CCA22592.1 AlNc14C160G7743 [Albugo laibachii Nc14]